MGMFDYVEITVKCPNCNVKINPFQTKEKDCFLRTLNFWEVDYFYAGCKNCETYIEFTLSHRPNRKLSLKDYNMSAYKPSEEEE